MSRDKLFQLNRTGRAPLHEQIEAALRRLIQLPQYKGGEVLPDEVTLSKRFGVSRNTLRMAIGRLTADGLLERVRKRGTIVKAQQVMTNVTAWHSFTEEMRHLGIDVVNFSLTLDWKPAPAAVLAVFRGADTESASNGALWCLRRVRGWDGRPGVIAESWFTPSLPLTGKEDFNQPLYSVIGRFPGMVPALSREEISAEAANDETAKALRIKPGAPILVRRRIIFNKANVPIENNINSYAGERYSLNMDLQ